MAPQLDLFGDITNSFRLYGTVVLILLAIVVFIGVAFVSRFATVSLACVILSIFCIYIGIFVSTPDNSVEYVSWTGLFWDEFGALLFIQDWSCKTVIFFNDFF